MVEPTEVSIVDGLELLFCNVCRICIWPAWIERHFGGPGHQCRPARRLQLVSWAADQVSLGLLHGDQEKWKPPPSLRVPVAGIPISDDWFKCNHTPQTCRVMSKSHKIIKQHVSSAHDLQIMPSRGKHSAGTDAFYADRCSRAVRSHVRG